MSSKVFVMPIKSLPKSVIMRMELEDFGPEPDLPFDDEPLEDEEWK